MQDRFDDLHDAPGHQMNEGLARVVAVDAGRVWLEPEQHGGCGGCASASVCGAKGLGTLANRLEARRFVLENESGLQVGDRVVLGVREDALIKAAATAYVVPLAISLVSAGVAQWLAGSDAMTLLAAVGGLVVGAVVLRLGGNRLAARGTIVPHLIRRVGGGEKCN